MELDDTIEQLRGMTGMVRVSKDHKYSEYERVGFFTFALMHACQASIYGNLHPVRYGMSIHDYKHVLISAAKSIMMGVPLNKVLDTLPEYTINPPIDWNYFTAPTLADNLNP